MKEFLSLAEASPQVGLKPDTLRLKIVRGEVRAIQPGGSGGKLFISRSEVERLQQLVAPQLRQQ